MNGHLKVPTSCTDLIRRGKLDSIGFIWDVLEHQFQDKYNELVEYKVRLSNCQRSIQIYTTFIPTRYMTSHSHQTPFQKRHGHCEVPFKYGPLGLWCNDLRMRGCKNPARHEKLTKLGFRWVVSGINS